MNKFLNGFVYAVQGLITGFKTQVNLRVQYLVFAIVLGMAWFLDFNSLEWIAMLLCSGMVIGMEYLNSALEVLSDMVEPNHNPKIKKVKDLSAAAVLSTKIDSNLTIITLLN
jgi:diacylglycerol kinase